jgi:hypothetical protein
VEQFRAVNKVRRCEAEEVARRDGLHSQAAAQS